MSNNSLLNNLIIKTDFFNTKFLYYNYYQFKKLKSIIINYRTPYCILDGVYFDCNNVYLKSVSKLKNSKSFMLELVIPNNHSIISVLKNINKFNNDFFNNIKLEINVKKRRTLKSNSYLNKEKTNYQTIQIKSNILNNNSNNNNDNLQDNNNNDNDDNDENDDNDDNDENDENDENDKNNDNNVNDNNDKTSKNRFDKIQNIYSLNKTYYYTNFLKEYKNSSIDGYIINCEIKSEFCQKLFYKLKSDLSLSKDIKTKEYINTCNNIIKSCNQEFFDFKYYSNTWDCENWNISIDCKIKSNSFNIIDDDDNNLNMIWKVCSFSS